MGIISTLVSITLLAETPTDPVVTPDLLEGEWRCNAGHEMYVFGSAQQPGYTWLSGSNTDPSMVAAALVKGMYRLEQGRVILVEDRLGLDMDREPPEMRELDLKAIRTGEAVFTSVDGMHFAMSRRSPSVRDKNTLEVKQISSSQFTVVRTTNWNGQVGAESTTQQSIKCVRAGVATDAHPDVSSSRTPQQACVDEILTDEPAFRRDQHMVQYFEKQCITPIPTLCVHRKMRTWRAESGDDVGMPKDLVDEFNTQCGVRPSADE